MQLAESDKSFFEEREFEFNDADFKFIINLVFEKTGINIQPHKKNMIYSRIARRIRKLNLNNFKDYCEYLTSQDNPDEIVDFINAVTTNLTKFFRENHHFEHLKEVGLPAVIGSNFQRRRLRIWSAGSSTGMEAYSIAMVLRDVLKDVDNWDVKILATDIDTNVLKIGQVGEYKLDDLEDVPKKYLNEYFEINNIEKKGKVKDSLRGLVHFKQLNFIDNWPVKGPFDIIFCRNVVIYFKKETQKIIFEKFANVISKEGFLYVGHSETLQNVTDRFKLIGKTIYKKVK
jgi:chemotaxis protein methyltransferase CheR